MSYFSLEERFSKSQVLGIKTALIFGLICLGFLVAMMGFTIGSNIMITGTLGFGIWMIAGLFVVHWKIGFKGSLMYGLGALGLFVMMIGFTIDVEIMISATLGLGFWFLAGVIAVYWVVTRYYEEKERELESQASLAEVESTKRTLIAQKDKTKNVCPECGTQIFDEETFCSHCGSLLEEDPLAKLQ